jgi:GGDEF domain-containing protein
LKSEARPEKKQEPESGASDRCLTLLVEGIARNVLEFHAETHKDFRANVSKLALQLRDQLPEPDKLEYIRLIVLEFETYRNKIDAMRQERLAGWRGLVETLVRDLIKSRGIDPASERVVALTRRTASLLTSEEIQAFRVMLADFLRIGGLESQAMGSGTGANRSTANDNPSGLRGGGAASEHVKRIMDKNGSGFVVLFKLGCLDMIGKRFGWEAVQDSLMAVSAFLTHSLRSDDGIYHWNDSSLLAVLNSPAPESMLQTAMQRIVDNNRDITIQIDNRPVMLRVPLEFDITPISRLNSPEDLYRL